MKWDMSAIVVATLCINRLQLEIPLVAVVQSTIPAPADSSSEDENGSSHDLDLGAFELVDSGMTAETLLSTEEPVIFHQ
ncbi:hypothetical protein ANCDUO_17317, partial [Ancylostoma duodenale]